MCDFLNFIQPQKNKIQYEFSMWRSPEMREGPHVQMMTSDAVIKILWFTCKFKF